MVRLASRLASCWLLRHGHGTYQPKDGMAPSLRLASSMVWVKSSEWVRLRFSLCMHQNMEPSTCTGTRTTGA